MSRKIDEWFVLQLKVRLFHLCISETFLPSKFEDILLCLPVRIFHHLSPISDLNIPNVEAVLAPKDRPRKVVGLNGIKIDKRVVIMEN